MNEGIPNILCNYSERETRSHGLSRFTSRHIPNMILTGNKVDSGASTKPSIYNQFEINNPFISPGYLHAEYLKENISTVR